MCSPQRATQLLFITGAALVVSAFVLEYGFGARPCTMCWWQRYAHWAITAFAAIALVSKFNRLTTLALAGAVFTSLIGLGIAGWQTLAQLGVLELPDVCSGGALHVAEDLVAQLSGQLPPPRCDDKGFTILGLSLAMWNIPAMLVTGYLSLLALKK